MTKPNLDEKRDAQFRHYRERQHPGKECPMCSDLYHGWNAGWNAALSALREVGEAKDARIAEIESALEWIADTTRREFGHGLSGADICYKLRQRARKALGRKEGE